MKKSSTKKVLICLSILFLLGTFVVSAISIDPWRFVATMRIQQINLYYRIASDGEYSKDDIVKAWMTNYLWINKWSLYIRPVDYSGNLVDETNNVVTNPDYASIIWWQMNTNNGDETTLILWWSKNTVGGHWVVLMWWDNNTATVDNAVILWSANSTVWSANWVVMASGGWKVFWNNSTMFWWGWTIATWADNSFAIGWGVTIIHQWVFSYWGTTSVKPNIAQFNGWQWIIVWWQKPNGNGRIKLSVNWALAVWRGICNNVMRWSIYYKPGKKRNGEPAYCLCACVDDHWNGKPMALSNQPYCNSICECPYEDAELCKMWMPECWTRWYSGVAMTYAAWEQWWRVASKFCEDNRSPIEYSVYLGTSYVTGHQCETSSSECNPPFPELGQTVKWSCPSVWHYSEVDKVECVAYRGVEYPELAECWENARRYKYYETGFSLLAEPGFCKYINNNPNDRAHNGKVVWYKRLSEEDVQKGLKSGFNFTYTTWGYTGLISKFPERWGRTYWKCETTNAMWEIAWEETTNTTECYADHLYCNHCATDGFPYCFDVKFGSGCDCTDPLECPPPCVYGAKKAWENYIYVSWNDTQATDTLYAMPADTTVRSNNTLLEVQIDFDGKMSIYKFPVNSGSTVRTFTADFKTTDVNFCDWTTTIYQCPKWEYWDEALDKCTPARCLGRVPAGSVPSKNSAPWNGKQLLEPADIFLTWTTEGLAKNCAYRCAEANEEYVDSDWVKHTEAHSGLKLIELWGSLFCAKCKDGTYDPELKMCVIAEKRYCYAPYEWFCYDDKCDKGECVLPGTCDGVVNANENMRDIIPPAGSYRWETKTASCVPEGPLKEEQRHDCKYTCRAWSYCDPVSQTCVVPECNWNSVAFKWQDLIDYVTKAEEYQSAKENIEYPNWAWIKDQYKSFAAFYKAVSETNRSNRYRKLNTELQKDNTNVTYYMEPSSSIVKVENNPSLYQEHWFFVQAANRDEFNQKTKDLRWCFAWCTGTTYRIDELKDRNGNLYLQYSCWYTPRQDPDPNLGGTPTGNWWDGTCNYKNLCNGSIKVQWKSYDYSFSYWLADRYPDYPKDWEYSETKSNQPCMYWCLDGYEHKIVDWKEYCWKKCGTWEFAQGYFCAPCPTWYSPTSTVDIFGNPTSCWKKCGFTEYEWSDGYCYPCGSGRKWDRSKLNSRWNSTSCTSICESWETYWTVEDGHSDCGYDKDNQIIKSCCLKTYANAWGTRCDQKKEDWSPKYPECHKKTNNNQICICEIGTEEWV